jgi:hypothetical protein
VETVSEWFFKLLSWVFTIGWIGCLLTIPMAAYKFVSVLFEHDPAEDEPHREFESIPNSPPLK